MIDDKAVKRDEVEDVQLNDDDSFMYFFYFIFQQLWAGFWRRSSVTVWLGPWALMRLVIRDLYVSKN